MDKKTIGLIIVLVKLTQNKTNIFGEIIYSLLFYR